MSELDAFIADWQDDPNGVKAAFLRLKKVLESLNEATVSFVPRPPASYSLRAEPPRGRPVITMVDVAALDGERFLSVCFYADTITDPDERGDLIPGGLLSKDGYCFDLDSGDDADVSYVEARIFEAAASFSLSEDDTCAEVDVND
ncbi:hypothetical protein [Solidesulfovibrio sp.]|jgi:hypothetical protein|uniref:hypothetical protein n=1 Tax=Solidesulfovibrio sp. TaxID=2910990 RepID=UPI000EC39444|nr:hypothetical protein [Solidesulfovibrio sp.]MEA5089582.1 hypothetical protein [Solidesulfovibrio sp.]HCR12101.1 hypothetical protein [Desulfovibrio sp.]HML61378.1 hypothetical protein [Solidesulfovibrio sp.]